MTSKISSWFRLQAIIVFALLLNAGCGTLGILVDGRGGAPAPGPRPGSGPSSYPSYRALKIPPGHLPPPGECRIWYPGKPPGHQPPPVSCAQALSEFKAGAWILTRVDGKTLEVKEKKNNAFDVSYYMVD